MRDRVLLRGLRSYQYEHPVDQEALGALKRMPALGLVVSKFNEVGLDEILRLHSLANKIRVSPEQFGALKDLFDEVKDTLDMQCDVDLYIEQSFSYNAYTTGVMYRQVTITTELIGALEESELRFVIGHELGHIKSEHVLYHQIGRYLPSLLSILGEMTLGLGRLIGTGFQIALYDWIRKSELSADRAGLLACQDPSAVYSTFCKLAGVPPEWFTRVNMEAIQQQAAEYDRLTKEARSKFYGYFGQMFNSHPWLIIRFNELSKWIRDGGYDGVVGGFASDAIPADDNEGPYLCPMCREPRSVGFRVCVFCGYYFDIDH